MKLGKKGQYFFVIDYETTGIDYSVSQPIEVGILVCDHEFNIVDSFQCLIKAEMPGDQSWLEAYRIHGIKPEDLEDRLQDWEVGNCIYKLAIKYSKDKIKPILVSDNIQFEWHWTDLLIKRSSSNWPFHYCGWDTSLLLEATGVGDPISKHRALEDAGLLHAAIVKALDRCRNIFKG